MKARLLSLLVLLPALSAQDAPLQGLDAYIEKAMRQWQIPGLAVAVVKNDKIVHAKGYGVRELGKPEKVDEHTVFAIASNTKAFTCAALSMLVEAGKLAWDDKICDILPWFQLDDPYATRDCRVLDLVIHNVGLPTFGGDHLWIGNDMPRRELLRRIRHQKLTAPFRSSFQYQNIMFTAAGEILPAKTGKSWSEFVRERLLEPLNMKRTTTTIKDLPKLGNVATPREIRGGRLITMPYDNVDKIAAAAALNSCVVDVAQWLRFNLAFGKIDGKRLLKPQSVDAMIQAHNVMQTSRGYARFMGQNLRAYGLGWFLNDYKGRKVVSHGGGMTGMISKTTWVPDEHLGIVVLTNMAENSLSTALTNRILDRYLGLKDRDWNAQYLGFRDNARRRKQAAEAKLAKERQPGTSPSLPLEEYTGTYHNPLPGDATVSLKDGRLYFFYNKRHRGFLTHWHHDTFRITWINHIMDMEQKAFVRFALKSDAKVHKLHTTWYHPITFEKK